MAIEIERKFLLTTVPDWPRLTLSSERRITFEQVYLAVSPDLEERVRKSTVDVSDTYHHAWLRRIRPGVREITEVAINEDEYTRLRAARDPSRHIIEKDRTCFEWRGHWLEVDDIRQPASRACHLLEIQLPDEHTEVTLPDFLAIDREVTTDHRYANSSIALG